MSKIQKALERAIATHADEGNADPDKGATIAHRVSAALDRSSDRPGSEAIQMFDELSRHATIARLDPDTLSKNRITTADQGLTIRSAYKMLRTRLLQRMRANGWTTLAVSSARANAGKTVTAINSAISIANEPNQRVILVDLDLRRPRIANYLGIETEYELSDYLLNDVPLTDIVVRTEIDGLLVIPSRTQYENSSELLSSPRMTELTQRLTTSPDAGVVVVFDLPPMLEADDMLAFSPQVDALLFVVAECETRRNELEQASNLLEGLNLVGVVLNKSSDQAPAYY